VTNNVRSGFWSISQAIVFIVSGDPNRTRPDLGQSVEDAAFGVIVAMADDRPRDLSSTFPDGPVRHAVEQLVDEILRGSQTEIVEFVERGRARHVLKAAIQEAEKALIDDFLAHKLVLLGRPWQPSDLGNRGFTYHEEIRYTDLLGEVTLGRHPLWPEMSGILVRIPDHIGTEKGWDDVLIPIAVLKGLHCKPLINLSEIPLSDGLVAPVPKPMEIVPAASFLKPAIDAKIRQTISEVYDWADAQNMKPPNISEIAPIVRRRLGREGLEATLTRISTMAEQREFKSRRLPAGAKASKFLTFLDLED
jgi:hypothetical protein